MKLLKILILFILFFFPFGELLRFQINNHVAIKPIDVVVGITAITWIVLQLSQKSKVKSQKYKEKFKSFINNTFALPFTLFASIGFVSLLINLAWLEPNQFFVSLLYLLRFTSYALLFPMVLQFDSTFKKKISIFLFIDGLIIVSFGYLQYFFYNSLKSLYPLGWDEHLHRMVSTFLDPNFAAVFFVLYLLFVGGIVMKQEARSKKQGFFIGVLLLTLVAIFLTFSRSGLLSLLVGGTAFLWLMQKKKLIFAILAAIILFVFIASPKFYDENMNLFREASSKARLENYSVALRVIQDHPIIGVGFNSYRYTKPLYGIDHDWVDAPSHADAGVDNSYLFVLATTGIIGLIVYGWIWVNLLKKAFSVYRKRLQIQPAIVIASSFSIFTSAFFINSLFFAPLMLWMWMIMGLSLED